MMLFYITWVFMKAYAIDVKLFYCSIWIITTFKLYFLWQWTLSVLNANISSNLLHDDHQVHFSELSNSGWKCRRCHVWYRDADKKNISKYGEWHKQVKCNRAVFKHWVQIIKTQGNSAILTKLVLHAHLDGI